MLHKRQCDRRHRVGLAATCSSLHQPGLGRHQQHLGFYRGISSRLPSGRKTDPGGAVWPGWPDLLLVKPGAPLLSQRQWKAIQIHIVLLDVDHNIPFLSQVLEAH